MEAPAAPDSRLARLSPEMRARISTVGGRRRIAAAARAVKMKRHFSVFVRRAWHVVEGVALEWTQFIDAICMHLQFMAESWLVANKLANDRQRQHVMDAWHGCGLTFREGRLLVQNMILNAPPGSLKSRLVMVFLPAWVWLHHPACTFAASSSNDENVKRDSDAHRDLVKSPWYRRTFGIRWEIRGNADAVNKWGNTEGGVRISRTFLSQWTGVHTGFWLIDDPDDALMVHDEPPRRRVHNKFTNALENRVDSEVKSIRILSQQRVHVDDLSGYLLALSRWSHKNLKGWWRFAISMEHGHGPPDADEVTPLGWRDPRLARGELMHPDRFPEDVLEDKRTKLGPQGFESQYNQNPEPLTGGMIERGWFRFFRIPGMPENAPRPELCTKEPDHVLEVTRDGELVIDELGISVDATFGSMDEKTASAVGLLVCATHKMRRLIFDDRTALRTFFQTVDAIKEIVRHPLALADPQNRYRVKVRRVLIELKANGRAVVESLEKALLDGELVGPDGQRAIVQVVGVEAGSNEGGKVARAQAMVPAIAAGTVHLLAGAPWLRAFLGEVCVFPHAKRDDRVDALSQWMKYYFVVDMLLAKRRAKW